MRRTVMIASIALFLTGAGPLAEDFEPGLVRGTALVSGDFDEDGVPDLVCGYESRGGGALTVHRGNVDAIQPYARRGLSDGWPFHATAGVLRVPGRPDFLVAGDFDNDGHLDLVLATRGGDQLFVLPGDGRGSFANTTTVKLPGSILTLVAGEINRRDGLADLVVSVDDPPAVLIFEGPQGALRRPPELIPLPVAAAAVALGRLDGPEPIDLALGLGHELMIVRGRGRRLSQNERRQAEVAPPVLDEVALLPSSIVAMASGDFLWDSSHREDLAVLTEDGTARFLSRGDDGRWAEHGRLRPRDVESLDAIPFLRTRSSGAPGDDLVLPDSTGNGLQLIPGRPAGPDGTLSALSMVPEGRPVAVLPMRLGRKASSDLVILTEGADAPSIFLMGGGSVFTVDRNSDTADDVPGDGLCKIPVFDNCTLRAAIEEANALPGPDTIHFSIGAGGTKTIAPLSALPTITEAVTIDGTTQPGFAGTPIIELDGSNTGAAGLTVTAGSSVLRGLVINRFLEGIRLETGGGNILEGNFIGTDITGTSAASANATNGVHIEESPLNVIGGTTAGARNLISANIQNGIHIIGSTATGTLIQGNFIGTDVTGTLDLGNATGVRVDGVSDVTIGGTVAAARNIISGNGHGIVAENGVLDIVIQGGYIGTDVTGTLALANDGQGILFPFPALAVTGIIGGTAAGAGNLLSGNGIGGVFLASAENSLVQGNLIGTDVTGTTAIPNFVGVVLSFDLARNNTIGGTVAAARNVMSGNGQAGIQIQDEANLNIVEGNYIGTDITGTVSLSNDNGVLLFGGVNNTIGGTTTASRNIISGNAPFDGILVIGTGGGNEIIGNYIGLDAAGMLLSTQSVGVSIGTPDNRIGGTAAGTGNVIAGSATNGVLVFDTGNAVLGNSIYSSGDLGIDLAGDGVTPNDTGDADSGPNNLQNFPVLTAASVDAPNTTIAGTLNSLSSTPFRIEFFSNPECNGSGNGEGKTFIGSTDVTTNGGGDASFSESLATAGPANEITATATDPDGNTSEFSACLIGDCLSLFVFGETLLAQDAGSLVWATAADVRFAKGDLAVVSSYATLADGLLLGASSLDISGDSPVAGSGLYYLVAPPGCGSWQTAPGAQPQRDAALP